MRVTMFCYPGTRESEAGYKWFKDNKLPLCERHISFVDSMDVVSPHVNPCFYLIANDGSSLFLGGLGQLEERKATIEFIYRACRNSREVRI